MLAFLVVIAVLVLVGSLAEFIHPNEPESLWPLEIFYLIAMVLMVLVLLGLELSGQRY